MSSSPTVFHVLSTLQTAGAETTSVAVVSGLRLAGVDARLATMREDRDGLPAVTARELVLPRHHLGASRIISMGGIRRLTKLAREHQPAILHAEDRDAALLCAAAAAWSRSSFVVTRHVLDEPSDGRGRRLKRWLLGVALRRADCVVAVSHAVAERVRVDDRVAPDRVRSIYNSLDPGLFLQLSPTDARARLGWPEQPTVVLLGAMRTGKGHDVAIDCARLMAEDSPATRMVFVGDGELRGALEHRAAGLVDFVGNRSDIPEVLGAADVVILPSDGEALPTVLIEAACASRPVVATSVGGIPEVVIDGHTGVLIPVQNPTALAAAIRTLLADRALARRLGDQARQRAIEVFSPQRQIDSLLDVYTSVSR
jgi:glycosyltransferase involved in cell wall biosynthesis